MALEDVTPVIQQEAEKVDTDGNVATEKFKRKARRQMNLWTMGLMGEEIVFRDGTTKAKVAYDGYIEPEGYKPEDGKISLTKYTKQLLGVERISPSPYWTYKGERLRDLYEEWAEAGFPDRSEKIN